MPCLAGCRPAQIVEAGVDWKTGQPLLSSVVQVGLQLSLRCDAIHSDE